MEYRNLCNNNKVPIWARVRAHARVARTMPIRTGKPTCQERSARTVVWRGFGKVLVARHDAQIERPGTSLRKNETSWDGSRPRARRLTRRDARRSDHATLCEAPPPGRCHRYACGPCSSRLLSSCAMSGLPQPSRSRKIGGATGFQFGPAYARSKNYAYQNWKAHLSGALRPDCGLARLWEGPGRAARCPD